MATIPYRQAVGSLMYLMICTRPDIAAAVQTVSRFAENPAPAHWSAVKRIFAYLQKTKHFGLRFIKSKENSEEKLTGYTDSDWGGCQDSRRSTTGIVFTYCGAAISWSSKRQRTVALSSCEAEYMAACEAAKEATWLKQLLTEMGVSLSDPIPVYFDSKSAMALIQNPVHHERSKHIEIRHHFVREKVEDKTVEFHYVPTDLLIADMLTKGVLEAKTKICRDGMGVTEVYGKR